MLKKTMSWKIRRYQWKNTVIYVNMPIKTRPMKRCILFLIWWIKILFKSTSFKTSNMIGCTKVRCEWWKGR